MGSANSSSTVDSVVHFDCQSAAEAVRGRTRNELDTRSKNIAVHFTHEKSHSGVALKEMVDGLAKLACKGFVFPPIGDQIDDFVHDKMLQCLWLALEEIRGRKQ